MADRENVINELNECIEHIRKNEFYKIPFWGNCQSAMMDALELITSQEKTIKDMLMEIESKEKPELVNTDEENYAHLPITKCPKCKRPIRMYYDPCHAFLTKACPYCGKVVRWE